MAMAFLTFGKRRRDQEPTGPDTVLGAAAARGISKFLVKYHGDQYSDEEILGESRRWQALFYPKGLIQNHMVFIGAADPSTVANQGGGLGIQAQFSGQTGSGAINLDQMPEMVGGC